MTQKEKLNEAFLFAMRVKNIANNIKSEGDNYDMQWHKGYVEQLNNACESILKKIKGG